MAFIGLIWMRILHFEGCWQVTTDSDKKPEQITRSNAGEPGELTDADAPGRSLSLIVRQK